MTTYETHDTHECDQDQDGYQGQDGDQDQDGYQDQDRDQDQDPEGQDHDQSGSDGTARPAQPGRAHLSAAGLRARGWTPAMVRQLLGEPDLLRPDPGSRSAPQTRLYRIERVEAAERTAEFRAVSAVAARRSAEVRAVSAVAARRSAEVRAALQRRRREVLARIAAEPLDVPRLTPARLAVLAVGYRQRRERESRGHAGDGAAAEGGEAGILDRWKVDYLCHRLTRHGDIVAGLRDSAGRAAAEELWRRRVYAAIAEAYPALARECERQVRQLPGRGLTGGRNSDARAGAGTHDRQVDRRTTRHGPQEPA